MKKLYFSIILLVMAATLITAEEKKLTVMDFTVSGSSESPVLLIVDYIAELAGNRAEYSLLRSIDRDFILEEISFSNPKSTDKSTQLQAAKLLDVDFFIGGSLNMGNGYNIDLNFYDVRTGNIIRSESGNYPDLDSLLKDCDALVTKLITNEQSSAASSSYTASTAVSTYKPRIAGKDYKYSLQGSTYRWGYNEFPLLADLIIAEMPENMEAKILYNQFYDAIGLDTGITIGGGVALLGGLGLMLPGIIDEELDTMFWIGAGTGIVGYIMLIVGLISESDVPVMAELVKVYNRR